MCNDLVSIFVEKKKIQWKRNWWSECVNNEKRFRGAVTVSFGHICKKEKKSSANVLINTRSTSEKSRRRSRSQVFPTHTNSFTIT